MFKTLVIPGLNNFLNHGNLHDVIKSFDSRKRVQKRFSVSYSQYKVEHFKQKQFGEKSLQGDGTAIYT